MAQSLALFGICHFLRNRVVTVHLPHVQHVTIQEKSLTFFTFSATVLRARDCNEDYLDPLPSEYDLEVQVHIY